MIWINRDKVSISCSANKTVHRVCPNHIKSSPLQFIVNVQESQNEIKSQSFDIHKYRRPLNLP